MMRLYPAAYRERFAAEMLLVLADVGNESANSSWFGRYAAFGRESIGLLKGALQEHVRNLGIDQSAIEFPSRRFTMRDGFRFPKSTAVLMTIILAGVILAIRKADAIQASLPHVNPPIGPIRAENLGSLQLLLLMFGFFYAAGLIGWGILFALRRSGIHRLADMSGEQK